MTQEEFDRKMKETAETQTAGQKGARVMLCMTMPLTLEERQTLMVTPYPEWPEELKKKTGRYGKVVEAEDAEAAQTPDTAAGSGD